MRKKLSQICDISLLTPFLISLVGIVTDYLTTRIGLGLGFHEVHSQYHPGLALAIFWSALTLLTLTLPKGRIWRLSKNILASVSLLGFINNTLVIIGASSGLVI